MQKTVYFRERTVRGSEIIEPGIPVSMDADAADVLLEDGLADTEPRAPETHTAYDTAEIPVRRPPVDQPSAYDHLVSGLQEASGGVDQGVGGIGEERDHTASEPPVITDRGAVAERVGVGGVTSGPGTRLLPPEPEARVQLLTGKSLNLALKSRGLPVGTDGANEKRVRLLADFHERGDTDAGIKAVVEKALEDAS